jgi:ArsR family transcriptional regulator, arsenate/arsenite/antimonite-responsive transcriptional repressor
MLTIPELPCYTLSSMLSEDDDQVHARLLLALANPVRQRILKILSKHEDTLAVEQLVDSFDLCQPTISHHLRILYDAGLLKRRKHRLYTYYSVRHEMLDLAASVMANLVS